MYLTNFKFQSIVEINSETQKAGSQTPKKLPSILVHGMDQFEDSSSLWMIFCDLYERLWNVVCDYEIGIRKEDRYINEL